MIFNEHLDRLVEVEIVQGFMHTHHMRGKMCADGENRSFILYRQPYVVGFWDALIENYLHTVLVDLEENLLMEGWDLLECALDSKLLDLEELRKCSFDNHPDNSIFLSCASRKMGDVYSNLEAIDKLLPLIESRGGLASMRDGSFDSRFDFSDFVRPIYPGLKERYLKCIGSS